MWKDIRRRRFDTEQMYELFIFHSSDFQLFPLSHRDTTSHSFSVPASDYTKKITADFIIRADILQMNVTTKSFFLFSPKVLHRRIRVRRRTPLLRRSACRAQTQLWTSTAGEEHQNIQMNKWYISLSPIKVFLKVCNEALANKKSARCVIPQPTTRCHELA